MLLLTLLIVAPAALARDPDEVTDDPTEAQPEHNPLEGYNLNRSAPLMAHDAATADIVSSGPTAKVIKNLTFASRGERQVGDATTDVWALGKYAYTGTFNSPCGGDPSAGVWIWDVHHHNRASFVGIIPSPVGSRSNDVKVAAMNSGDILVHSNESCGGGPGGFDTVCSAFPDDASCDPGGTYPVQNVLVETTGNKVKAYISWYWDGMLVLDVSDPYNPSETARFFDNSPEFVAGNGGNPHDFWGVYKQPNSPWIYGSDRNGGLYVLKEYGSGSAKNGQN